MSNKINQELQKIEIPEGLHERAKLGVKLAKEEHNENKLERSAHLNYKRWIPVACAFGILLLIMIGTQYLNKNVNFAITAYALSDDNQLKPTLSSEKATFEFLTEDRIDALMGVSGDGANLIFTDVLLNITGEQIDSITYTMNKGNFIEEVRLTEKERRDYDWLVSEKIYIIHGEPDSGIYEGIKEIGNTYTVKYNEQDKYDYTLAIPHDGNEVVVDDIVINVLVKYMDGSSEQQDIVVTQESGSISLKLK